MKFAQIFVYSFIFFFLFSCNWLDCRTSCTDFEFTFEYSIENFQDTVKVGDTLILRHDFPFILEENKNGVAYDLSNVTYFPFLTIGYLEPQNRIHFADEDEVEIIPIGQGEVLFNNLSDGGFVRDVHMAELNDRNRLEVQVVPRRVGEIFLLFAYVDSDLYGVDLGIDTCCSSESLLIDYDFISENTDTSRFINEPIWFDDKSAAVNLLEGDERYDICTFFVKE